METIVKNQNEEFEYIDKKRQLIVYKSNNIIKNSKYTLSAQEINIINLLVSKIKPDDTEFEEITFDIGEFCKICGICDSGNNYKEVQDTILKLRNKAVWVKVGEQKAQTLSWIDNAYMDYSPEVNILKLKLSDSLKPFFLQLKSQFTQYPLELTLSLKSKYSKRIYELLKCELYRGKLLIEVEDLKRKLECENYKTWQDFKVKVIEIAQREINESSDLNFTYSVLKTKRKFTHIEFVITEKKDLLSRLTAEKKRKDILDGSSSTKKQ
jgi:plasmid replication initiation protein